MYLRKHERVIIRRVKWPLGPFSTEGNLECLPTSQVLPPCFPTPFFFSNWTYFQILPVHTKNKDNNKWAFFSLLRNPPGILLESPVFTYFDTEVERGFSFLAQGWIRWTMNHLMIRDLPSAQSRSLKSLKSIEETLRLRPGAPLLGSTTNGSETSFHGTKTGGSWRGRSKQANRFFRWGCCSRGLTASAS